MERVVTPALIRLNSRAVWWPLGVFKIRSGAPIQRLIVDGKRVKLQFPMGEYTEQQWEINHLFCDDPYGLKSLPKNISTVLDIGGNIGFFSILARHYFPLAAVHCYEPNAELIPVIRNNTEGLGVTIFEAGVGLNNSTASWSSKGSSLCGVLRIHPNGNMRVVSIRDALDRLGQIVDLVKMDCEGGEWMILEDSESLMRIKHLSMEYHLDLGQKKTVDGLVRLLKAHGFAIDALRESSNRSVGQLVAHRSD
jgi:FkbM family methyltransferase